jgi:hypothetical protein
LSQVPPPSTYLGDLADHGLDRDTIEALQAHGLATIEEVCRYTRDNPRGAGAILDDAARYRLVGAVWRWLGRPVGGDGKGGRS